MLSLRGEQNLLTDLMSETGGLSKATRIENEMGILGSV